MPTLHPLTENEVKERLESLPEWTEKKHAIVRVNTFLTYLHALEFVDQLGHRAEKEDHHPYLVLNYKTVTISFSTHSANGITDLDFKMAKITDVLIKEFATTS